MANERTCLICGAKTKYCPTCRDSKPNETWKMLFHDEKCLAISNIWYAYRGKEISKEEAKEQMSQYSDRLEDVFKHTSIAAKEIREIFDIPEKNDDELEVNVVEEIAVENPDVEELHQEKKSFEPVSDQVKQSFKTYNGKHNNKK